MLIWAIRVGIFLMGATMLLDQLELFAITGAFPVSPNKVFTAILLGLAIMYWIVAGGRLPSSRKTKWLILFYVSLGISSGHAAIQGADFTWIALRWTTFIAMFVFYYLLLFVVTNRKHLDIFLFAMMVSGVIASLSALLLEGSGGYYGPVRRSGVGSNENQAAGNLLMLLPLVYALFHRRPSVFQRAGLFGISVIFVVGFTVALSRSAFLAALAMGAMWAVRMRRLSDLRIVFAGIVFVLIAYFVAPEGYAERLESLAGIFDSTRQAAGDEIGYRARIYQAGLMAFIENPIIGVGLDQFVVWAGNRDASLGTHEVHNSILNVAANQGLFGVVPYLALVFLTFSELSRVQAVTKAYRHLADFELDQLYVRALTAQVGFVGIMGVAMFQPGTFWRGIWALFAISTVLVELTRRRLRELGVGRSDGSSSQTMSSFGESSPLSPSDPLTPLGYAPQSNARSRPDLIRSGL